MLYGTKGIRISALRLPVRRDVGCAVQDPFLSRRGKKRFLDSKERRPEEVSSGLHEEAGSPRAEPGSPLYQWGVPWVRRIPLGRCRVLLTGLVPRTEPRLGMF